MDASIPIIDFSSWTTDGGKPEERLAIAHQLVKACHETGFVYISNHGIPPQILEEAFVWAKNFFDMPHEKKMEAKHPEGSVAFRGYAWPGLEKANQVMDGDEDAVNAVRAVPDYNENYNLGSDDNPHQPNTWPAESTIPGFRDFTTKFYWECWQTTQQILRALAIGLGLEDEEFLLKLHDGNSNQVSLRHYLPIAAAEVETNQKERLAAHTDISSITLLFQDDCGGLEVEASGQPGKFIPAPPIENALVMNIGDILMRWSNDYLISTMHRVRLPPLQDRYTGAARMTRERYSIPYFVAPRNDVIVECLPTCYNEKEPAKYAPIGWAEYLHMRSSLAFGKQ